MTQCIFVRDIINSTPYWAADDTLPKVKARFKRLTGKFPSKNAVITAFTGTFEDIDKITIDDIGTLQYPKTVIKIAIQN